MESVIAGSCAEVDMFLFLGDCIDDFIDFQHIFSEKKFFFVNGNCDFFSSEPSERIVEAAGKKIFMTHGHRFGVKSGHQRVLSEAVARGADICLYGHSHKPHIAFEQGIHLMNPGSISLPRGVKYPSYGVIEIEGDKVNTSIVELI